MKEFVAHLHPVLVHLPIGILLLAAVFAWMGRQERHAILLPSLPILLRLGAVAAVVSCLSGWLLGGSGEYAPDTLRLHQWLGISTAALALLACFIPKKIGLVTVMAILLIATGHFGGTMTHGEGYLTWSFQQGTTGARPVDVQEAALYAEIITPIFQEKCITCHGNAKQKGGLRLDQQAKIQAGGKDGDVLNIGNPNGGELLRRCLLPLGHEDHMPPKEKPQLTPDELEILRWWLAQGADFQKKTKEVPQTEMVRKALINWQGGNKAAESTVPDVPAENVEAASPEIVEVLQQSGLLVLPVSRSSNWLSVNFVNLPKPNDSVLVLLEKIAPQVVWLNMAGCSTATTAWNSIGKMTNLTRLSLNNSSISDSTLASLKNMPALQYLNLSQTKVTASGLRELAKLKSLQHVFLYRTGIQSSDWPLLKSLFPQTSLDTGGYAVPFMDTDTVRLKAEKAY